jgi:site-specific recombinase XerD
MPSKIRALPIPLLDLFPAFALTLQAAGRSPETVKSYRLAVNSLDSFLHRAGQPRCIQELRRAHVEAYIAELLRTRTPGTAANRYRSLQQFFKWAAGTEKVIAASPMAEMRPPHVPEQTTPLISEGDIRALFAACAGATFEDRRDTAILALLVDTGMRRGELAGMRLGDLDRALQLARVVGKGSRPRSCPYGKRTAVLLDRYLRIRAGHRLAHRAELWLGRVAPLTASGIYQMLRERAKAAGLQHVHTHQFRHGFAHAYLAAGGQETDLLRLAGWKSRQMLSRYGAAAADERAREAYKKLSPMDRL